jgi:hypothetical protein
VHEPTSSIPLLLENNSKSLIAQSFDCVEKKKGTGFGAFSFLTGLGADISGHFKPLGKSRQNAAILS